MFRTRLDVGTLPENCQNRRHPLDILPTTLDITFWQISVKVAGKGAKIGVRGGKSKIRKSL